MILTLSWNLFSPIPEAFFFGTHAKKGKADGLRVKTLDFGGEADHAVIQHHLGLWDDLFFQDLPIPPPAGDTQ